MTEQEADLDSSVEHGYARVPAFRPEPEMQRVRDGVAALGKARKPVIVAGGGVVRSGAQPEVVALAEKLQIPVITSLQRQGNDTSTAIRYRSAFRAATRAIAPTARCSKRTWYSSSAAVPAEW